jgi:molecular chaperone DnaJ
MKRDYYEVLGVERSATPEQIRQAYRRLARRYHPDVNNGDPEADARFKEINEAHEVLRDPERRAAYDRFGHAATGPFGSAGGASPFPDIGDIGDLFDQIFGFGGRQRPRGRAAPERGGSHRTHLTLELTEAAFGVTKTVEVTRHERCAECGGTGAKEGSGPTSCRTCQGTGAVRRAQHSVLGTFVTSQTCPECRGTGEVIAEPCPTCGGEGRSRRRRRLEVDVPAGVEDGTQIRLGGEGDVGPRGGLSGDLFVSLSVQPHPVFERQGNDLHVQLRINPAEAALGTQVTIPTLEGTTVVAVPAGTQPGAAVVVEGLGVPRLRGIGRGDLIVDIGVEVPTKLTRDQRRLLEQLLASLPPGEVADRGRGVWERVRERFG